MDKKAAVTDVDVQKDSNIRKKEDENLEIPECERDNRQEKDNTGHWIVPPKGQEWLRTTGTTSKT